MTESKTVTYLPAGQGVIPTRDEPKLDPELARIRDEEIKSNDKVKVEARPEPTIDPELVKARKAELERDAKRAGVKLSDTSVGKSEAASEPKVPAKKSASKSEK